MENGYEFLLEKEEMWARMLCEVLEDNGIPYVALPVYGAGFTISTGRQELLRIFVPSEKLEEAYELSQVLFAPQPLEDGAEDLEE